MNTYGLVAACLMGSTIARAEDWPQWRGPRRDGVSTETGLLKSWPKGGPELKWKAAGLGNGYGSVAVANGQVITTGDARGASYVFAVSEKDGTKLWEAKLGKSGAPGWGGFEGPRSTPSIDGPLVVALGQNGELVCYENGKEKWRKDLVTDFGGLLMEWGYSESPLIDGKQVVCTPGGRKGAVVALEKATGAVLWQSNEFTDEAHYSSLVPATIHGVKQYVQLTAESVVGISAAEGKLLWKAKRRGETAVIPTPLCYQNEVFVSSGYGVGCNLFRIGLRRNKFEVEQVYANKLLKNHHGGVVRLGDYVYGSSDPGLLVCMEWKTGRVAWEDRSVGKGSLGCADGKLYLRREDGTGRVALIDANPKEYKEISTFDPVDRTDKNSWAQPVIANGNLYLRDQEVLLCYKLK